MTDQNKLSELEEMYLLSIARSAEDGGSVPVSMSEVAERMQVQPVSANHMIHKLQEIQLVEYTPYQGVALTEYGQQITNQVLRQRRLWEVFLVEHLQMSPGAADELACKLEHDTPAAVADRLDAFLGHPEYSPQGKKIPTPETATELRKGLPLDRLNAGSSARVLQIEPDEREIGVYLEAVGIRTGSMIEVMATTGDGPMLISTSDGKVCQIAQGICKRIWVIPL